VDLGGSRSDPEIEIARAQRHCQLRQDADTKRDDEKKTSCLVVIGRDRSLDLPSVVLIALPSCTDGQLTSLEG
jgi:hypothetical protein